MIAPFRIKFSGQSTVSVSEVPHSHMTSRVARTFETAVTSPVAVLILNVFVAMGALLGLVRVGAASVSEEGRPPFHSADMASAKPRSQSGPKTRGPAFPLSVRPTQAASGRHRNQATNSTRR